jgi:flagellar hook-associated protein 3 FlgL
MQGIASDLKTYAAQTDSSGNPLYAAGSPTQIPIGDGTTVAAAESYDQVFGSVTLKDGSTTSIDDIVSNAITALQTTDDTARGTAAAASLDALDAASTHISDEQSDLGVREGRFNAASDALADSATNLKVERSGLEDTDITDAYATMSNKMTILNAAQSVLAQINKISLFDKIS